MCLVLHCLQQSIISEHEGVKCSYIKYWHYTLSLGLIFVVGCMSVCVRNLRCVYNVVPGGRQAEWFIIVTAMMEYEFAPAITVRELRPLCCYLYDEVLCCAWSILSLLNNVAHLGGYCGC